MVDAVDFGRELAVFVGHGISGIVGAERDLDLIIHIAPVGMMVHFFSHKGDFGHKAEGLYEITELKAAF